MINIIYRPNYNYNACVKKSAEDSQPEGRG